MNEPTLLHQKKALLVVDAANALYRAHYGILNGPGNRPYLKSSKGIPTGALMTMINMVLAVEQEYQKAGYECTIVLALESKIKTFRDELQESYKQQRAETPQEVKIQLAWMEKILPWLGWEALRCNGYEADDILATLGASENHASLGLTQDWKVVLMTSDKDALSSIKKQDTDQNAVEVEVWNWNLKGVMTSEEVVKKFGVLPHQIQDFLVLMGDSVDGVEGIDRVGKKTAAKWINRWGSIESWSEKWGDIEKEDPKAFTIIRDNEAKIKHNIKMVKTATDLMQPEWNVENWGGGIDEIHKEMLKQTLMDLEMTKTWEVIQKYDARLKKDGRVKAAMKLKKGM